ncbi:apolipoprotein N-acyltransferase [Glaciimonas sp. Gout2]|uniref:apolipoprotein N-acyltransferase n=1 Tax=unclassified Glaciimonas TaxID=2644401 RepID=UPI002B22DB7B|nr:MULTISPECIES: apolipoprotein N-acyltransferase [unclassified Glaciimonas]MEB0011363.1 apolipoprotein N-acyltransferase [Glaciimonas sp. Cout2]MEB0081013.1 apolipoprotein N-acyltransferase [Glaciimonas sp. Gout2]
MTLRFTSRQLPLATLLGALNVLAFAPFGAWPIQLLTLALLIWRLLKIDSVKQGMLLGWAFGFGWSVCGVYWLYISMHVYGGMPAWITALAVGLLALFVGLHAATAAGLTIWLRRRWSASPAMTALAIFPSLWALSEWVRGWIFTGFPWLVSGYAHTASPLAGYAPIIGVYGLGMIAALIGGCLALLLNKNEQGKLAGIAAIVILLIGVGLHKIDWTKPTGQPISVRLLQGNIAQEMKFDPAKIDQTLGLYKDLISAAPADLIATPETAIPLLQTQLPPEYLPAIAQFARQSGSYIAVGIPITDGPNLYANSVLGFSPNTAENSDASADRPHIYRYDKHHLVPFGEFIPYGFHWFVDLMNIPLGDFTRGAPVQPPFAVKDQWVLPNICYEDLFGEEIAAQLAASASAGHPAATILLNMSNIAWFGDSIALPQHLQISQMRSIETGRPMLRATNTGTTAVIDPHGNVTAHLAPLSRDALAASIQGFTGNTPYILLGNRLLLMLATVLLAITRLSGRQRKTKKE